ncbi:MerR family transcriptional regulator [Bacillus alkalicellulosilyticus]|uniref:helix-turn-helix domain-containing protein n=1 Tax=Alkalihalobacterium alkalicellulosilyticum TaxID=1912214 RepID=UPI001481D2FB|nr:MerR family transcriptional regulator [Bacillus alkalicellulosilyticus]
MERTMTIQAFSENTGLPASTLRYYEKEGLLQPFERGLNGYRQYSEEQIPLALTIHSLRLAGVNMKDIKSYLHSSEMDKLSWVQKWSKDLEATISTLQIARQYLQGIKADDQSIRLIKWDKPVPMIWFPFKVPRQIQPYTSMIIEKNHELEQLYNCLFHEVFIKTEKVENQWLLGEIGFRFPKTISLKNIEENVSKDGRLESMEPTLFVSLECSGNDPFICFNMMMTIKSFGFEPCGEKLEKYNLTNLAYYQWMIPVLKN